MKKLLIFCALLFGIVTLAQAQGDSHKKMASPEARAKMSAERLSKRLDLNKDQRIRIEDIYLQESLAMAKEKREDMGDNDAKKAAMMKIHDDANTSITAELTEPQKQKYESWKMDREKSMKKMAKGKSHKTATPAM